jgi:hypothetical protein
VTRRPIVSPAGHLRAPPSPVGVRLGDLNAAQRRASPDTPLQAPPHARAGLITLLTFPIDNLVRVSYKPGDNVIILRGGVASVGALS